MMGPKSMGISGYWRRILIVNAVAGVAAFALLGGFTGVLSDLAWVVRLKSFVASLIYANCIGGLMAAVMPRIGRVACQSRVKLWSARLAAIAVLTFMGCAMAGGVLVALTWIRPSQYLVYLRGSLTISYVIATAACLSVIAYETMRGQLEATSLALRTKERDEANLKRVAAEAQLASLESRVQPHFLFNTLNSIAALIHDDPGGAERMTGQLASLLRSSLDQESTRLVPLRDELRVVRDYLDIEQVRFGGRLRYSLHVPDEALSVRVPRLAVQTLVENSVKYGVSPRREGASLVIRASMSNGDAGRVSIAVNDDGPGFAAMRLPEGHGLALLRSRLAMLFGDRAALKIDSQPGETSVVIELPSACGPREDSESFS
jgi:signal transduction histidine kinase